SDHLWAGEINRLSKHRGFRFNATHTPSDDTDTVYHGRMGICANERVREGPSVASDDTFCQIFQINLMADPHTRWHNGKIVECLLAPFQEFVPFGITLVFQADVIQVGVVCAEIIHLHGVVYNQIDRNSRVDLAAISTLTDDFRANGRHVHYRRYAGKILHQYPGG